MATNFMYVGTFSKCFRIVDVVILTVHIDIALRLMLVFHDTNLF